MNAHPSRSALVSLIVFALALGSASASLSGALAALHVAGASPAFATTI
jgi:hypothetical protein